MRSYTFLSRGPLLVLLGALAFSTTGSTRALCMPGADSLSLTLVRSLGAGLILFALCALRGQLALFRPGRLWFSAGSLQAFFGILGFQLFFFAALPEAGVTVATVVTIGTVPVSVGILGYLLLGERPSSIWYKATALALFSVALLGFAKSGGHGSGGSALGVGLAVAAGCSYGMFVVRSKALVVRRPPEVLMTVLFAGTTFCLALAGLLVPGSLSCAWLATPAGLGGALFLVVFSTALAYILTLNGLKGTPVALAATLALGEPLGATILGICLLGEPLDVLTATGIVLLFASMILLGRQ